MSSLKLPSTIASLSQIPPFAPANVTLANVHKTGLGSSAALITSLVSALLLHFSAIPPTSFSEDGITEGRSLAHNVSQYIHCLAQGKVGSGFDVSSAVFGSQIYTRFDPSVIQDLMVDTVRHFDSIYTLNDGLDVFVGIVRSPLARSQSVEQELESPGRPL